MSATIIDNFLPEDDWQKIHAALMGNEFPWYYNDTILTDNDENNPYDFQFTHIFYSWYMPTSSNFALLAPLIQKINPMSLLRIKANLSGRTPEITEGGYHTDYDSDCITAVYYINSNDGYTKFETGQKVESVKNRFVFFPSHLAHTGSTCTNQKARCLINLNYTTWESTK